MLVLLDTGANVNMITPECMVAMGLKMGPLKDLWEGGITINQPFNYEGRPIGYVIMRVQIDGISGYDKDQVAPVLKFADYLKPFMLETDASSNRLGAVLLQEGEDGKLYPIAYRSQSLTKAERNYHSDKTDFLMLKWAVTDHFKEHLIYQPFVVQTDNNPLTYLFTTPNLDACGH